MKSPFMLKKPVLLFLAMTMSGIVMAQTKNDLKFTLLSLGSGSSRFTYERAFSPRHSAELTYGAIGWGWDIMNHTEYRHGRLVKAAFKWNLVPQNSDESWLGGLYVKPELVVADFDYRQRGVHEMQHTRQSALMAEGGYQWVKGWFDFDIYAGLGLSTGNGNVDNYFHSFMLFPVDGSLAFTAGFRIGVAF